MLYRLIGIRSRQLEQYLPINKGYFMDMTKFESLLNDQFNWPDQYKFKFVTKTESVHRVSEILDGHTLEYKESRNGKYTSITSQKLVNSSDEVVEVYKKMSKLEGVITL